MIAVSQKANEQVRFKVTPLTESGAPAKIDQQDQSLEVATLSGDGSGVVENIEEYTVPDGEEHAGKVGHRFDVVTKPGTGGTASELELKIDADNDAGEIRLLTEKWNQTTTADEAASLSISTGTVEPLA